MTTILILAAMLAAGPGAALAQAYPTKPVTLALPQAAGGATDVFARYMAQRLSRA